MTCPRCTATARQLFPSYLFSFFILFSFSGCGTFPKAVKLIQDNKKKEAKPLLERSLNHKVYGPGAHYYQNALKIYEDPSTMNWLQISHDLCVLEAEVRTLPLAQRLKLQKYKASLPSIEKTKGELQRRIVEQMRVSGRIDELQVLEADTNCWMPWTVDTIRKIVVNKTINPLQTVYQEKWDEEWEPLKLSIPDVASILARPDRSCYAAYSSDRPPITYSDATTIINQYANTVLRPNYDDLWDVKEQIWKLFKLDESFCKMDTFKETHAYYRISKDCWFDAAAPVLCEGDLKNLLLFHRDNPHTALDYDICNQIVCRAADPDQVDELNASEVAQLEDVRKMLRMVKRLNQCDPIPNPEGFVEQIALLAEAYPYHFVAYDLAQKTLDHFVKTNQLALAKATVQQLKPLYPDSTACDKSFNFQVNKQRWFTNFEILLDRLSKSSVNTYPVAMWNTSDHDEYALISWGETSEVFFVRRHHESKEAKILTSVLKKGEWTIPTEVEKLSFANDAVPLSISSGGRMMLLKSEGKIFRTIRPDIGRPWLKPEEIKMPSRFAGDAWLSPDDSLLLISFYKDLPDAITKPKLEIGVGKLNEEGSYSSPESVGERVNISFSNERRPIMALKGRMLFYISDRQDGIGDHDMYAANLGSPRDWTTLKNPRNLGLLINTIYDDNGLTYFSEYTDIGFFHRYDPCQEDINIWQTTIGLDLFPDNAMRMAGIIVDEEGENIGGGFMEFTADYNLNVHSEPISLNGTYSYTVLDRTKVVRLFPEVPGYYSERDTIHFLDQNTKGRIIRDTFQLTSFDYIRRNFKLKYSTFINGTATFNDPKMVFPELTRLAKIATRMGAELELHGHTDNFGTPEQNKQLSIDRAASVRDFLVNDCGFDPNKIAVYGYGAEEPNCTNDTEEGRRCNRRVEVKFRMPELGGKRM